MGKIPLVLKNGLGTLKIKRTVPLLKSILESFTHPSQKPFSIRVLLFAKQHHDISNDNIRLIKHCRNYYLATMNHGKRNKQKAAST